MDKPYFVMLYTPKGGYTPLMEGDDEISKFETVEQAREGGQSSFLGEAVGFEVHEIGTGQS